MRNRLDHRACHCLYDRYDLSAISDFNRRRRGRVNSRFYLSSRLPPYVFNVVNELKARARARGEDIIDFGMGNPDLATPPHVVEKLVEAARKPRNHRYSASRGITKLRHAIADWYWNRYQVSID